MTDKEERSCVHCTKRQECDRLTRDVESSLVSGKIVSLDGIAERMEFLAPACKDYFDGVSTS